MNRIGLICLFTLDEPTVREIYCLNNKHNRGNLPIAGEQVAAVVVKDWGVSVNVKLLLDGPADLWVTSTSFGTGLRTCQYIIPEVISLSTTATGVPAGYESNTFFPATK